MEKSQRLNKFHAGPFDYIQSIIQENYDNLLKQDDTPPHFDVRVRNFLNKRFPVGWIGTKGSV